MNFDTIEDDEECETHKPQMKNAKDKEQIKDPMVNTIFIFNLQRNNKSMSNNCKSARFGMKTFKDDMTRVSIESTTIFVH